jgi:hypothetical protein
MNSEDQALFGLTPLGKTALTMLLLGVAVGGLAEPTNTMSAAHVRSHKQRFQRYSYDNPAAYPTNEAVLNRLLGG